MKSNSYFLEWWPGRGTEWAWGVSACPGYVDYISSPAHALTGEHTLPSFYAIGQLNLKNKDKQKQAWVEVFISSPGLRPQLSPLVVPRTGANLNLSFLFVPEDLWGLAVKCSCSQTLSLSLRRDRLRGRPCLSLIAYQFFWRLACQFAKPIPCLFQKAVWTVWDTSCLYQKQLDLIHLCSDRKVSIGGKCIALRFGFCSCKTCEHPW